MYIDGFVLPVRTRNLAAYKKLARAAAKVWIEYGALGYYECVADDPQPGFGLPFPKLCACQRGETVIFSYIAYRSRAHRDRVNKKVMRDARLAEACQGVKMPFDATRMAWGGFKLLVKG